MPHRTNELRDADRKALRAMLDAKRAELVRAHDANLSAGTHPDPSVGDPMDAASRATDELELLGLATHERALLAEVDHALAKMAHGTYGLSELSGEPIPIERLRAVPWARLTADEEERREHRR
ncbi:MAG TPA: TraR/DksA family transcriptional regulator [Polyangiaceae bacterium]|nr:TraR/DksA family transcriptional regulator [Polyangiaceae bacterium]